MQYFQNFLVIINTYFAAASIVCCYARHTMHQHLVSRTQVQSLQWGQIGQVGSGAGPVGSDWVRWGVWSYPGMFVSSSDVDGLCTDSLRR